MDGSDDTAPQNAKIGVILHGRGDMLPPNAVLLSPMDVFIMRKSQLNSWEKRSEVWPLIYGPRLATLTVSITSFIANINARQLFNLQGQRLFWSTTMPTVMFPTIAFWAAFDLLVFRPILTRPPSTTEEEGPCSLCLQVRASAIQIFCGSMLSGGLAFLTSSLAAITDRTYPVPSLSNFNALWANFKRYGRGFRISGPIILLLHTLMGAGLVGLMLDANQTALEYQKQISGNTAMHPSLSGS